MTWTAPMTAVERAIWSSAQWNAHVRDNLLETMAGRATTAGRHFVSTGAGAIAERACASAVVATSQTRSNAAYGDLTTAGPAVTVTCGSEALVWIACESATSATPGTPEVFITDTATAADSAAYAADGTNLGSAQLFQGVSDGVNGNQFSMVTFDYATIASDLAGADIVKTEVFLDNLSFYSFDGGNVFIGTHTNASVTGDADYATVTPGIASAFFGYAQSQWVTVPNSIGEAFRDGTAKGLAIGKAPSDAVSYAAEFAGATDTMPPQIRITSTKIGTSGGFNKASVAVSGDSTIAASDDWCLYMSGMTAANAQRWGVCHRMTGLTPGSNTFTMKYATGIAGATGTFQRREIIVMPL